MLDKIFKNRKLIDSFFSNIKYLKYIFLFDDKLFKNLLLDGDHRTSFVFFLVDMLHYESFSLSLT